MLPFCRIIPAVLTRKVPALYRNQGAVSPILNHKLSRDIIRNEEERCGSFQYLAGRHHVRDDSRPGHRYLRQLRRSHNLVGGGPVACDDIGESRDVV